MSLLVRTWNLFHGRTAPESGKLELERMVRLVTADGPDVVALQEVPVWALARLGEWSGMRSVGATTMPALGGPLARRLTELEPTRLRSLLTGQANAMLLGRRLQPDGPPALIRLNPRPLRRVEARRQELPLGVRFEWAWNRRLCQALPVRVGDRKLLLANLHATKAHALAALELERLPALLPGAGAVVLCGDFNVPRGGVSGFSTPIDGIDQILLRDLSFEAGPVRWDKERRRVDGLLLSDHAPVEAVVA